MKFPPPPPLKKPEPVREIYLHVGDVIHHAGRDYVVDLANDCRARCKPLTGITKTIVTRSGDSKEIERKGDSISVSRIMESHNVIRRISGAELTNLLSPPKSSTVEVATQQGAVSTESNKMPKVAKKQSDKPSKGRSAYVHKLKMAKTPKAEALASTQEKFDCPEGLFDRIWARGSHEGAAAPATPKKGAKKKPGAVPPPKEAVAA